MPENPFTPPATLTEVRTHLHTLSQLLRQAQRLGPEAQELLADLIDELGKMLEAKEVPSFEVAQLTASTANLMQAVQHGEEAGVLQAARERLQRAVIAAETEAPVVVGLTRRLAEMLSNLGI